MIVVKSIGFLLIVNSCTYTSVPKCLKQQYGNYSPSSYSIKTDIIHFGGTYRELKKRNIQQFNGANNYVNHEDTSTTIQNMSFFKNLDDIEDEDFKTNMYLQVRTSNKK